MEIAKQELDSYNRYLNGEGYVASILEIVPLYDKEGNLSSKYETETVDDYCIDDISTIPEYVPEKFKEAVADAIASY